MSSTKQVQQALVAAGFNPGVVDGIIGRNTIAAIKKFQAKKGLEVDGIAGKQTLAALGLQSDITSTPTDTPEDIPAYLPWLVEARRLVGLKEFAGKADNPILMKMAEELDLEKSYTGDDVPWCGLFVGHCIASQLPQESLPSGLLMARNWRKFGSEVAPSLGAVMVFWRGQKDSGLGHVGFYYGEDHIHYFILGGNQSNQVSVTKIAKNRLLAARWPRTAPHYALARTVVKNADGIQVSTTEA